jgi:hypothetical protein
MGVVAIVVHHKARTRMAPPQWSLTVPLFAGLAGMAADNAFGNVSLFFAVPGFLFFWVLGQWAALHGKDRLSHPNPLFKRMASIGLLVTCVLGMTSLVRGFIAEAAFHKGSAPAPDSGDRIKEGNLLRSKYWKRYDVHTAFELGNLYSQRMDKARALGFQEELRVNAEKAVEAYTDALRSNPSYNEVFEARARAFRALDRESESDLATCAHGIAHQSPSPNPSENGKPFIQPFKKKRKKGLNGKKPMTMRNN